MKTTAGKVFEFKLFCSPCQIVRRLHPSIGFSYGLRARICGDCQVVEICCEIFALCSQR